LKNYFIPNYAILTGDLYQFFAFSALAKRTRHAPGILVFVFFCKRHSTKELAHLSRQNRSALVA
jgi:hypothetical protein